MIFRYYPIIDSIEKYVINEYIERCIQLNQKMGNGSISVKIMYGEEKQKLLDQRKAIEDLEHELQILETKREEEMEQEINKKELSEGINIGFGKKKKIIVLGSAGSGKTWLLKRLAYQFAINYKNNTFDKELPPLPLFIQLSEMANFKKDNIDDFMEGNSEIRKFSLFFSYSY